MIPIDFVHDDLVAPILAFDVGITALWIVWSCTVDRFVILGIVLLSQTKVLSLVEGRRPRDISVRHVRLVNHWLGGHKLNEDDLELSEFEELIAHPPASLSGDV